MTLEDLKEHCEKTLGIYSGHVTTKTFVEHSLVLDLIKEHENRAKHDSDLLDKVMQKQRTIIDDDGVMYKVVLLKDIEDLKAEVNECQV